MQGRGMAGFDGPAVVGEQRERIFEQEISSGERAVDPQKGCSCTVLALEGKVNITMISSGNADILSSSDL
jgi:hypothetical protein